MKLSLTPVRVTAICRVPFLFPRQALTLTLTHPAWCHISQNQVHERVRDAVGESHWTQARKIQKQLVINQQMKKLKAMKDHAEKTASNRGNRKNTSSPSSQSPSQCQPSAEAMEAAEAMSALSRVAPNRTDTATPTRSNNTRDKKVGVSIDEKKDYDINHKPTIHDPGSTRKQN
jgi:hypothetical protein